ncbi:hypothetical protein SDC9_183496 [bioreactor metagenome]|uniref:Uncharacterized protein n=1 Tax=bioreactor metagenome TaxID=1076179 RepID=A0A645HAD5_9ZZZZ
MHGLQRQAHDHMIEESIFEVAQALVHVGLHHVHPVAHAGQQLLRIVLDAVALNLPYLHQVLEQAAVAAAEVEHPLAGCDPLGDHFVVVAISSHAYTLMRSNQADSTAW